MKNEDKINREFVHLYLALRRNKENPDLQPLCFRQIIIDDETDLEILKTKINKHEGTWRIHKTVNKRDCKKAGKLLMHKLIDEPALCTKIPSLWKTCLMKPEAKGERKFLLDIDNKNPSVLEEVLGKLRDHYDIAIAPYYKVTKTPNGYHMVVPTFDGRILNNLKEVTVHRDGYIFVELCESEFHNNEN